MLENVRVGRFGGFRRAVVESRVYRGRGRSEPRRDALGV